VLSRLRVRFVLPAVVLGAVVVLHPGLARAAGVDFWNLADARAELATAAENTVVLTHRDDTILRRIVIKEDLVAGLVASLSDLAKVAAEFLELNADESAHLDYLRTHVPGDSDLERSARNVIDYAASRTADETARERLVRRLEAELARMQDADHAAR